MSSRPTPAEIARDARWLAQALDPASATVRLIEMTRDSYRTASFLDDRMLQPGINAQLMPWQDVVADLGEDARRDAGWIFHIGHVGSTLIARLLGELEGVLSVREPRILRDLALAPPDVRAGFTPRIAQLFSRTFAPDEVALVKATSFVSEIAVELAPAGAPSLFVHTSPRVYIATILAGENSMKEMAVLASSRQQRMAGRVPDLAPSPANEAELAAAVWACEMTALEQAAEAMTDRRTAWLDFDSFLGQPESSLAGLAQFFGHPAEPGRIRQISSGPLMSRYSKALEYEYSASLRQQLIAQAESQHGRAIDRSLAMLERAAATSPLLARALSRTSTDPMNV